MKSKRRRAIIKALYKEINSYGYFNWKIEDRKINFFFSGDKNKVRRLTYKIKYQKSLIAAKKRGF